MLGTWRARVPTKAKAMLTRFVVFDFERRTNGFGAAGANQLETAVSMPTGACLIPKVSVDPA
jgi:hypothetical protein